MKQIVLSFCIFLTLSCGGESVSSKTSVWQGERTTEFPGVKLAFGDAPCVATCLTQNLLLTTTSCARDANFLFTGSFATKIAPFPIENRFDQKNGLTIVQSTDGVCREYYHPAAMEEVDDLTLVGYGLDGSDPENDPNHGYGYKRKGLVPFEKISQHPSEKKYLLQSYDVNLPFPMQGDRGAPLVGEDSQGQLRIIGVFSHMAGNGTAVYLKTYYR